MENQNQTVQCHGRLARRKFLEGIIVSSSTEGVKRARTGKQPWGLWLMTFGGPVEQTGGGKGAWGQRALMRWRGSLRRVKTSQRGLWDVDLNRFVSEGRGEA